MNRLRCLILLAASLGLGGCDSDEVLGPEHTPAARIVLANNGSAPLESLGDTAILTARVLDRHGRLVKGTRVRWSVAPEGVVARDADGIYRAIGNGRATIVAMVDYGETGVRPNGYWADPVADSVVVEVRQRATRITFDPVDTAFTTLGSLRRLYHRVTDARGNPMLEDPPPLTWRSADSRVATVDSAGVVRSVGEGVVSITAQADQLGGSVAFTVMPRLPHTSCMVFTQRRQTQQTCVTLEFVMREREDGR